MLTSRRSGVHKRREAGIRLLPWSTANSRCNYSGASNAIIRKRDGLVCSPSSCLPIHPCIPDECKQTSSTLSASSQLPRATPYFVFGFLYTYHSPRSQLVPAGGDIPQRLLGATPASGPATRPHTPNRSRPHSAEPITSPYPPAAWRPLIPRDRAPDAATAPPSTKPDGTASYSPTTSTSRPP